MGIRIKHKENVQRPEHVNKRSLHIYLEVPDEWCNAAVRLIVIFLMRQFL